jgi:hypothetical protein
LDIGAVRACNKTSNNIQYQEVNLICSFFVSVLLGESARLGYFVENIASTR